jgi:hypothetical protein
LPRTVGAISDLIFPSLLGNSSVNTFPPATNTRNRRNVGRACLCVPLTLLGNGSINTLPRLKELLEAPFSMRSVSNEMKVSY